MRKPLNPENIISALIGVALTIPLCVTVYKAKPVEYESIPTKASVVMSETASEVQTEEEPTTEYREYIGTFSVTAYCSCDICCPGTSDGITYTGTVATEGRTIAVDPDVIPLGSVIEVNGVKYVAEDIGGAIKGNKLDIYFNSHEDAREWGVQDKEVYLLSE